MRYEQLYPKEPRPEKNKSGRRFRVEYDLVYDGGSSQWSGYYRTSFGARISAFRHVNISSWGGSAILYDTSNRL